MLKINIHLVTRSHFDGILALWIFIHFIINMMQMQRRQSQFSFHFPNPVQIAFTFLCC